MPSTQEMLFRMAYRMAMADGEMSANEALILHLFQDNLGLGADAIAKLKEEAGEIDWEALPTEFPERKTQLELFETACLMAMIDGRSDPEEWNLVIRLCEVLDIDRPQAQDCLANARERLNKLAEVHNLLPEIMKNMESEGDGDEK